MPRQQNPPRGVTQQKGELVTALNPWGSKDCRERPSNPHISKSCPAVTVIIFPSLSLATDQLVSNQMGY